MSDLGFWSYDLETLMRTIGYSLLAYLALGFLLGALFCGILAHRKGYPSWVYAPLGLMFGPIVLLFLIGLPVKAQKEAWHQIDTEREKERILRIRQFRIRPKRPVSVPNIYTD